MTYQLTPDELVDLCRATGCSMSLARSFLGEMNPKLRSRVLLAVKSNITEDELLQDPIELDAIFKKLIEEAAVKAKKNVTYKGRGVCHMLWEEQKNILKDEHGIDWYSPAEMNPWVEFD